ncbi:hypothetical protein ABW19_dt0208310 [Dactylella cylindrospora]|nr:hypothetical protein ABW19_dt0208310 [Dactylella cylindrospora]
MSCMPLSCFGNLFQRRRKDINITGPLETQPEATQAPRLARLPITAQPTAMRSPKAASFRNISATNSPTMAAFRRPSTGSTTVASIEPIASPRLPPPVYDSTITAYNIPVHPAHRPKASLSSPGRPEFRAAREPPTPGYPTQEVLICDEKPSVDTLRSPRSPMSMDLDPTPRFQKIFKIFSSTPTTLTFTPAVKEQPAPSIKSSTSTGFKKFSRRFSRRWVNHEVAPTINDPQNQAFASTDSFPRPTRINREVDTPPPVPQLPPSGRKGIGQCLSTRTATGEVKPVTMVPRLRLDVPKNRFPRKEVTPIETSPVNDPWRHSKYEIEGMSDKHQAWML